LVLAVGAVGPVSADRAVVRWLLGTTADRAVLLRGGLVGSLTGSTFAGAVGGMLTTVAATGGGIDDAALAWGAALGAALGGLVPLLLLGPQASDPSSRGTPGTGAGRMLAAAGLLLLGWLAMDAPLMSWSGWPGSAGQGDAGQGD